MANAAAKTKVRSWIETGGIFASYVEPYSRVRGLFLDLLYRIPKRGGRPPGCQVK